MKTVQDDKNMNSIIRQFVADERRDSAGNFANCTKRSHKPENNIFTLLKDSIKNMFLNPLLLGTLFSTNSKQ